jgi:hypothetical protein
MAKEHSGEEGNLYAVPIGEDRYVVCLLARDSCGDLVVLGYFFDRLYNSLPSSDELQVLRPYDAHKCIPFSALCIADGRWPLIGRLKSFSRSLWPMPKYRDMTNRVSIFDENRVSAVISTQVVSSSEVEEYDYYTLWPAGAIMAYFAHRHGLPYDDFV